MAIDEKYADQSRRVDADLAGQSLAFDPNDFHCKFRMYQYRELKRFLASLGESLNDKHVVVLGCGKGFDFFLLKHFFPDIRITGVDISPQGIAMANKAFSDCEAVVGNMESLEFDSDTFDYAIIPAALHHLQNVYSGLYEAIRVSRKGAILLEPYDSPLARLATFLGAAHEYEDVGNYVFRTSIKEMKKVGKAMFMDVRTRPYFWFHYTAKSHLDYALWLGLNRLAGLFAPMVGNACLVYFRKDVTSERKEK